MPLINLATYIALFYLAIRHGTAERGLVPRQSLPGKCRIRYDAACIRSIARCDTLGRAAQSALSPTLQETKIQNKNYRVQWKMQCMQIVLIFFTTFFPPANMGERIRQRSFYPQARV